MDDPALPETHDEDDQQTPTQTTKRKTKVVLKIPQSKIKSVLGNEIYVTPTFEEVERRQKIVKDHQEERSWCRLPRDRLAAHEPKFCRKPTLSQTPNPNPELRENSSSEE